MEDLHMNTSQNSSFNYTTYTYDYYDDSEWTEWIILLTHYKHMKFSMYVFTSTVISVGLPLTLVAIYALYSQIFTEGVKAMNEHIWDYVVRMDRRVKAKGPTSAQRLWELLQDCWKTISGDFLMKLIVRMPRVHRAVRNGQVAPIYVINLLITDIIQLCCMIVEVAALEDGRIQHAIVWIIYNLSVAASVGFMVCVALERYLVVAWPLWYRFRRTIKTSVVVCVVVWIFPLIFLLILYFWVDGKVSDVIFAVYLLLPFPLLIFFLGGTLKALSASTVPSDEKRRIVGVLVLVLLIYTLLFMPRIICFLSQDTDNYTSEYVTFMVLRSSPLADLFLYVFMRKGIIDKLLASVCCCRMDSNDISRSSGNDDNIHTVSSV